MFGEDWGAIPNPPSGLRTAIKLPGQVRVGFILEKSGRFEEAGHVGDPGIKNGRLEAAGRPWDDELTVGPSSAMVGSGVVFYEFRNFFVERVWDDIELIDIREESEERR